MTTLPGGEARRSRPAGLVSGRTRSHLDGPFDALALVAEDLRRAELALRSLVVSDVGALEHVSTYLIDAGGKRLRPALTALGGRAVGVEDDLAHLMCAGELIHLGSLLHDDVVDEAPSRRGRPSAHTVHGNAVAILAGDYCVSRAIQAAWEHGGAEAATRLSRTVAEMSAGEVLQLQRAGRVDTDRATYLSIIDRKSASLIAWCASAAALRLGDADAADALERYGRLVGLAYQITDDVLDYEDGTGKHAGADLRERKITLPLLYAFDAVDGLRDRLAARPPEPAELPELVARIRACGALDAALSDARDFVDDAMAALEGLPVPEGRDALAVLGTYLVERTS